MVSSLADGSRNRLAGRKASDSAQSRSGGGPGVGQLEPGAVEQAGRLAELAAEEGRRGRLERSRACLRLAAAPACPSRARRAAAAGPVRSGPPGRTANCGTRARQRAARNRGCMGVGPSVGEECSGCPLNRPGRSRPRRQRLAQLRPLPQADGRPAGEAVDRQLAALEADLQRVRTSASRRRSRSDRSGSGCAWFVEPTHRRVVSGDSRT